MLCFLAGSYHSEGLEWHCLHWIDALFGASLLINICMHVRAKPEVCFHWNTPSGTGSIPLAIYRKNQLVQVSVAQKRISQWKKQNFGSQMCLNQQKWGTLKKPLKVLKGIAKPRGQKLCAGKKKPLFKNLLLWASKLTLQVTTPATETEFQPVIQDGRRELITPINCPMTSTCGVAPYMPTHICMSTRKMPFRGYYLPLLNVKLSCIKYIHNSMPLSLVRIFSLPKW